MLKVKNRTQFSSIYELDETCFTKDNSALAATGETLPYGVLGGSLAALSGTDNETVVAATKTNVVIGFFANNAAGNPFENAPAVAANKIAIVAKLATVETDMYEDEVYALGDKLYASDNGVITKTASTEGTVVGICTKVPSDTDPFLGLEMRI